MTQHIGPYEIRGEFGRGAMAVVWEAWDPSLERVVAVKEPVVSAALPEDEREQFSQRFVREAKSAARLNHPGIVTIYSADVFEGRPAIVMEAIQGSTLADLMERGDLSTGAAVSILDQLLDAAGYAHSQGIVHRDIKPDNIFVTEDGRVKLADFGIAHVDSDAKMTQAGTMMGTPGYMAPEQVTGSPVDGRTDIFAVGVIGYEMLMGENPFGADAGTASTTVMYRIVHDDVPFLAPAIVTATPPFVADAIRIAMAKDPAARFASAEQMRAYLRGGPSAVAAGAYVPAAQAAVAGQAAHSGGPNKGVLIGAGIVVAAAMLLGVMFLGPGSGGAGTGGSLAQGSAQAAAQPPAAAVPESQPSGPTDAESRSLLATHYAKIVSYGDPKRGSIAVLAAQFNADPLSHGGASASTTAKAEALCDEISGAQGELESAGVSSGLESTKRAQVELYGFCLVRARGIRDACYASQQGASMKSALDAGRKAKASYLALLAQGRP